MVLWTTPPPPASVLGSSVNQSVQPSPPANQVLLPGIQILRGRRQRTETVEIPFLLEAAEFLSFNSGTACTLPVNFRFVEGDPDLFLFFTTQDLHSKRLPIELPTGVLAAECGQVPGSGLLRS